MNCSYSLAGGAHEGLQHLGPFGNIPNIVAELTGDNIPKDFSEDQGYPDPPNPCPVGKTGNGCALGFSWMVDSLWEEIKNPNISYKYSKK